MQVTLISLLVFKLLVPSTTSNRHPCEGKVFLGMYYEEQVLFSGLHKPINLVMHDPTNTLFFSHSVKKGLFVDFNIRMCSLTDFKCKDLKRVVGGRAIAYDRKNNEMYLGGRNGIYKYDFKTKSAYYFAENKTSIWNLFVQKHLYYIDMLKKKLHVYEKGKFKIVPEVSHIEMDNFFVSKNFAMYYSNKTAVYRAQRPMRPPRIIQTGLHVKQITQDYATDNVFFVSNEGMYYIRDEEDEYIKEASEITSIHGMTFRRAVAEFETGQLIYSSKTAIMRLVPGKHAEQCLEIRSKKSMFYMRDKIRKPSKNFLE